MNRGRGAFDGLPIPADKSYLRDRLARLDESWAAARFDSLPHVVQILTSRDRDGELQSLKEQSELVEDVVDEVVQAYHHGFNKAIQNYSQILRLFSESAESISVLKVDMAEAQNLLGSRNKQLGHLWYRSLTLRHVLSLLDQIEDVSKVPARIDKMMSEKQLYAAVQLYVRSVLLLDREGLQVVGALQDIRTELTKLRGVLFYKIVEELHNHIYNKGEYSSSDTFVIENGDTAAVSSAHPISRRTRSMKGSSQLNGQLSVDGAYKSGSVDSSSTFESHDDENRLDMNDNDGEQGLHNNGHKKDLKTISAEIPNFLLHATPDEFIESMTKTDVPLSVKYLRTLVECLCLLGKVAAAGAVICQRLRPTIHDIITSKVKAFSEVTLSKSRVDQSPLDNSFYKGSIDSQRSLKQKNKNGTSFAGTQLVVSPISSSMAPLGPAQHSANHLLSSILDSLVQILENHFLVSELLELKASTQGNSIITPKASSDANTSPYSETGGFSVSFSLSVVQSECQQLICEIIRATPEAAATDAAQKAQVSKKEAAKEKRDGSEGLSFAFRITDAAVSKPNEDTRQGWRRTQTGQQEGYGTASVLPELGIYLAASIYRPIFEFCDKIGSLLPPKYANIGKEGLLAFVNKFIKDNFLPAIFVDYRKCVQQAISSPAAFRPRIHSTPIYSPLVEKGRPVLQGLLAVDVIAKEVLGWVQLVPNYATDLVEYVRSLLERTHERCRTSYMEAVLGKQSYILLSRSDIENLMRLDPANAFLQTSDQPYLVNNPPDTENVEVELDLSDLLLELRPIKQENLIQDDQKLVLLASLSDSLEYLADSVERLGESFTGPASNVDDKSHTNRAHHHARTASAIPKSLASLASEYRRLAIDCLKVLRLEMQLETVFHLQEMNNREYLEDQDAEEPDDFIISLTTQIQRREEELSPFVADLRRSYIFGGISSVAANASIKALAQMKSINLLGVHQICRNSIALQQALEAIPSIDGEAVQKRLDRVRTFYELLNLPFENLLSHIVDHEYAFHSQEYVSLLKVIVPGREIPPDAERRISDILAH